MNYVKFKVKGENHVKQNDPYVFYSSPYIKQNQVFLSPANYQQLANQNVSINQLQQTPSSIGVINNVNQQSVTLTTTTLTPNNIITYGAIKPIQYVPVQELQEIELSEEFLEEIAKYLHEKQFSKKFDELLND